MLHVWTIYIWFFTTQTVTFSASESSRVLRTVSVLDVSVCRDFTLSLKLLICFSLSLSCSCKISIWKIIIYKFIYTYEINLVIAGTKLRCKWPTFFCSTLIFRSLTSNMSLRSWISPLSVLFSSDMSWICLLFLFSRVSFSSRRNLSASTWEIMELISPK